VGSTSFRFFFCFKIIHFLVSVLSRPINFWSLLKLILNHQESRCTENHNIVKFRTLFGEAGLHKKGQTADFTLCAHSACAQYLTVQARANYYLLILLFISSIFFQKCHEKYVKDQKSSIFVIIAPNNLKN
jgi:hypothetical protein